MSLTLYTLGEGVVLSMMRVLVPQAFAAETITVASRPEDLKKRKQLADALKVLLQGRVLQDSDALILGYKLASEHGLAAAIRLILGDIPVVVLMPPGADSGFLDQINVQLAKARRPLILTAKTSEEARKLLDEEAARASLTARKAVSLKAMASATETMPEELVKKLGDNFIRLDNKALQNFLNLAGVSQLVERMRAEYLATARSA